MSMKQNIDYPLLISEIEKFNSETHCQSIEEIISIVDYALRISYSGYLQYDAQNSILKLHSHSKDRTIVPWALIIVGYVKKFGNDAQIIFDKGEIKPNMIHIKLLHPSVIQIAE
jgi:hypothetical protein